LEHYEGQSIMTEVKIRKLNETSLWPVHWQT